MSNSKLEPSLSQKMVFAGTSACVADLFTFPFDVAKVRLQIAGEAIKAGPVGTLALRPKVLPQPNGLIGTLVFLTRTEGVRSLYGGIGPGLQRQCVFASIRIGFYDGVKQFYTDNLHLGESAASVMLVRILSGITTGAVAISFAQPTDVVKVRMQAQSRGSSQGQVRYRGSIEAYRSIYKQEGVRGLWKGLGPNVARNSVVNAAELVCYDSIKDLLVRKRILNDGMPCHFTSAFAAGFVATLFASPIDVVKTRVMNSSTGQYSGVVMCAKQLYRQGGFMAFYKGFTPSFMRLGTWNICMFVTYEQLKKMAMQHKENTKSEQGVRLPTVRFDRSTFQSPFGNRYDLLLLPSL